MRFIKHILTIITLSVITSCALDELELPSASQNEGSNVITVLGRVTRFTDQDVETRGVKHGDEGKITSMALAIFKVNNAGTGIDGNCVYYQYSNSQSELFFTIDRSSSDYHFDINTRYAMYVFTNMPDMDSFGVGSTLEEMLDVSYSVQNVNVPANGFPMIGSLGDTFSTNFDRDGQTFVLSPSDNNGADLKAPTVNGESQNLLTIPMKAVYSKMNFSISVRPDQAIEGNYSSQFTLTGYTVNNVPATVDFDSTTNSDTEVTESFSGAEVTGNLSASGANSIEFSFYVPERYLIPATSSEDYDYPFELDEEHRGYMQRYKGKLLGENQKATNIVISGRYRDHQNHYYDIEYTIYLGSDSYGNFDVVRNTEYNNYITIRGIMATDDMSDDADVISIDHRVNVNRTQPAIIGLRREVLLDSHFEVRPMRIRSSEIDGIGDINAVKVEVLNPTTTNWMRLERSFGVGSSGEGQNIYISDEGNSKGKRKYFTYNLITGKNANGTNDNSGYPLTNNTSVVVPLNDEGECVWIYADECLEQGDDVRSGIIQLTYGTTKSNGQFTATTSSLFPPIKYTISQRKLFNVTYGDSRTYNIEYHEEYLHNFDVNDDFGLTDDEGMVWGLPGLQLSYDHQAILIHNSGMESLTKNIRNAILNYSPYYDFYLTRDFNRSTYYFENDSQYTGIVHDHNGFVFCNEIIAEVNSTAHSSNTGDDIKQLTLAQKPKSAIEYCYNKNKRDANGNVVLNNETGWYLPAIDEAEEIMMSQYTAEGKTYYSYARFSDFQDKFYWSSQPAYYKNIFLFDRTYITAGDRMGHYMMDNPDYARATRVLFKGGDPDDPSNYENARSGMKDNSYYVYLYMVAGGSIWEGYPDVKSRETKYVKDIATPDSPYTFKWDNNDVNETTEYLYPPDFQEGYKHRTNDKARVRCVRKMN